MMVSPTTQFWLVTGFDQAKLKEAEYFSREIKKGGYHLSTVILNRVFPTWLKLQDLSAKKPEYQDLVTFYEKMKSYYNHRDVLYRQFESRLGREAQVLRIPDLLNDISDLGGLEELSNLIVQGDAKK
ncbi:hypothetical protein D3C87_1624220 [compost metagenome]